MKLDLQTAEQAEVPMSPLIDCVFLLLIFFLVATMFKKQDKDIDVDLPVSTSSLKLRPDDGLTALGIDRTGQVYLEGAPISRTRLHAELRRISNRDPNRRVRLDADRVAPIHAVVEILDICQFRGLNNIGIRTYDGSQ